MKVTLDTNCLIALENNEQPAPALRDLLELHAKGIIELQLASSGASERQRDEDFLSNIGPYLKRIGETKIKDPEILPAPLYFGPSFFGYSVFMGGELTELEREIHHILFPEMPFEFKEYLKTTALEIGKKEARGNWRNKKCDVWALWSHVRSDGDLFVTLDSNFHKQSKREALEALGANRIVKPKDAVEIIKGQ